jgi:hypothetical protein
MTSRAFRGMNAVQRNRGLAELALLLCRWGLGYRAIRFICMMFVRRDNMLIL